MKKRPGGITFLMVFLALTGVFSLLVHWMMLRSAFDVDVGFMFVSRESIVQASWWMIFPTGVLSLILAVAMWKALWWTPHGVMFVLGTFPISTWGMAPGQMGLLMGSIAHTVIYWVVAYWYFYRRPHIVDYFKPSAE